jgi:hypothetical protein
MGPGFIERAFVVRAVSIGEGGSFSRDRLEIGHRGLKTRGGIPAACSPLGGVRTRWARRRPRLGDHGPQLCAAAIALRARHETPVYCNASGYSCDRLFR